MEAQQNTPSLHRKIITAMLKSLLLLMIVIGILLGMCIYTLGAPQAVISSVSRVVDELTIDYHSGGLGSELNLSSVKWQQSASHVDINDLLLSVKTVLCIQVLPCVLIQSVHREWW